RRADPRHALLLAATRRAGRRAHGRAHRRAGPPGRQPAGRRRLPGDRRAQRARALGGEPMTARAPAAAAGPRRVLALRGARIARGGRTVLDRVDWDVHAGETWFVLGPNGAGKTTLLHAVLGLLPLAAGRIERDPEQAALERIGFVP